LYKKIYIEAMSINFLEGKYMKTSIIVASIVLIVIAVGVTGLYMTGYFTPPTTIRVGYLQGDLHQLALQVAIAEGYFTQRGLNVTLFQYPSGPTLMQHFVAGELDFAYVGVPPALQARASAIVTPNATQLPVVIASANQEGSAVVVNSAKIPTLAALNGSHIGTPGVGTIQDVLLDIYANDHNIIINKFPSTNAQLVTQFQANLFDGFIAWEPTPSLGVLQANGSILLTSHDILPNHQCCVVVVSDKFLVNHTDIVAKFVDAHNAAMDFINTNPIVAKQVGVNYTGLSADVINLAFSDVVYNKTVNVDSIRTFLIAKIQLGQITTVSMSQVDSFMSGFISTEYIH
jgi:NitT/TauT family transport system substrate-binding protein